MGCAKNRDPTWLQKVSFIKHYALNSCEEPWLLYLQTGGRALGNLAMTATFLGPDDLVRSFFRPKGKRSAMHSMLRFGRNKSRAQQSLLLETSDLVADGARATTGLKRPVYSDFFNHIWEVDNHMQKLLGRIVMVNMATDFAYDWFSGILEAPESKCSIGRFSFSIVPGVRAGHPYMLRPVTFRQYTDGTVINQINGVHVTEGTWLVRFRGICGGVVASAQNGDIFWALQLGQFGEKACHAGKKIRSLATGDGTTFEFTRIVTADDWINIALAVVPDVAGTNVDAGGLVVSGFRLA